MRILGLLLCLLVNASVLAQNGAAPYKLDIGTRVRISTELGIDKTNLERESLPYIGYVESLGQDSLVLAPRVDAGVRGEHFTWAEITRVERYGENRTGEALGLLIGGVGGAAAGYVLGDLLIEDPLGKLLLIPGSVVGMLVGGVIGAHVGDRWHEVPRR